MPNHKTSDGLRRPAVVDALEFVFRESRLGVCVVDDRFRFREVNRAWCSMLQRSHSDLLQSTVLDVTHPEDLSLTREYLQRLMEGDVPGFSMNKRWLRSNGESLSGHAVVGALHQQDSSYWALAIVEFSPESLDSTERQSAFETYARGVAHDLNNVVTVIRSSAENLAKGELSDESLKAIAVASEHAADLSKGLLAKYRSPVEEAPAASVASALGRIETVLRPLLPDGIWLERATPDPDCRVHLAPAKLDRVLLNLILNARDAMPAGGGIQLQVQATTQRVRIDLIDPGEGMSPEIQDKIFSPYFSSKSLSHGSGLGLHIARGIVEEAGGGISVVSEPGAGSTFSVSLPRAAQEA